MSNTKIEFCSFIKDCLLKFDYPLAHSMTDEELGDIFNPSNRCFLISWILKLLDSTYEEVLENRENDKECLGNIVYEHGFCTIKEKLPFMTGELPVPQQVKIIYDIFTFIVDIKKIDTEEKRDVVTNDELAVLNNVNLNLFPTYGDIKYPKSTERCSKLQEFQKEIDEIKAKVSTEDKLAKASPINHKFSDTIEEFLVKANANFSKMSTMVQSLVKDQNGKNNVFELHPDSTELLKDCVENIRIISQFVKDIRIIQDFIETASNSKMNELVEEITEETTDMIQTLYQEILTVRKYTRCL